MKLVPTLVVGLGGTGKLGGKYLKYLIQKRIPEKYLNRETGLPDIIDILHIDTSSEQEIDEPEFLREISIDTIQAVLNKQQVEEIINRVHRGEERHIAKWFSGYVPSYETRRGGVGQVRQAGRLALFLNFKNVNDGIKRKIDHVFDRKTIANYITRTNAPVSDGKKMVCIIASASGGTGSGLLLDVIGLISDKVGPDYLKVFIIAPEVLSGSLEYTEDEKCAIGNFYAFLKDVNYFHRNRNVTWQVDYGGGNIRVFTSPLFHTMFILDNSNNKVDLGGRRLSALGIISEVIYRLLTGLEDSLGQIYAQINRDITIDYSKRLGGIYSEVIEYPKKEVDEWLKFELLIKTIENLLSDTATSYENEINNFINRFEEIFQRISIPAVTSREIKGIADMEKVYRQVNSDIVNQLRRIESELDEIANEVINQIRGRFLNICNRSLSDILRFLNECHARFEQKANEYLRRYQDYFSGKQPRVHQERKDLERMRTNIAMECRKTLFKGRIIKKYAPSFVRRLQQYHQNCLEARVSKEVYDIMMGRIMEEIAPISEKYRRLESKLRSIKERCDLERGRAREKMLRAENVRYIGVSDANLREIFNKKIRGRIEDIKRDFCESLETFLNEPQQCEQWLKERAQKEIDSINISLSDLIREKIINPKEMNELISKICDRVSDPLLLLTSQGARKEQFLITGNQDIKRMAGGRINNIIEEQQEEGITDRAVFINFTFCVEIEMLGQEKLEKYFNSYWEKRVESMEIIESEIKAKKFKPLEPLTSYFDVMDREIVANMREILPSLAQVDENLLWTLIEIGVVKRSRNWYEFDGRRIQGKGNFIRQARNFYDDLMKKLEEKINGMDIDELKEYFDLHKEEGTEKELRMRAEEHKQKYGFDWHPLPERVKAMIQIKLKEAGVKV